MSDRDELASRVRVLLAHDERVTEKKMFGGLGYMLNGNMIVGVTGRGELMARYGKEQEAEARALPGASDIDFDTSRRGGFLMISRDAIEGDEALEAWVEFCRAYGATLKPK